AAVSSISATSCDSYTLPWGASVSASGDYSHTYATVNGCDSVVTAHVTINHAAVSSISATSCDNYTLPWGATVAASGDYSHTYATVNGCDSVVTAHVTINASPVASATNNSPACEGSTLSLSASGGTSYSWTGPNGFTSTSANPQVTSASSLNSGTYTVAVTNSSGCIGTATTSVNINAAPIVTVSSNSPICSGGSSNCSGFRTQTQGGWGAPANGNNPAAYLEANYTAAFPNGLTIGCGANTLKLTSASAIEDFLPSGSTASTLPAGNMVDPGSNYNNVLAAQLVAAVLNIGFDQYDANFSSNSIYTKNLLVNSGNFAGWTVEQLITEANNAIGGCSSSYSLTDLNNALDAFNNNYDNGSQNMGNFICQQSSQQLLLSATSSGINDVYSWSGPNSFTSSLQNPSINNVTNAVAGTYAVTVTNSAGCSTSASTTISVNTLPSVSATGGDVCTGSTLNLTASGGTSYSWNGPNGFTSSSQNPSISNVTSAASGTYTVTATNSAGCSSTVTVSVTVKSLPTAVATGGNVCTGSTLNLSASGGTSYTWIGPNGFTSTLQNPSISNVNSSASGTYTLTATNNGCSATTTATVSVNANPTASAAGGTICAGSTLNLTASGGSSYSWAGPNGFTSALQNPSISNATTAASGNYTVTVINAAGCTNSASASATVNAQPTVTTSAGSVCAGSTLNLTSSGGTTYSWTGPNGFTSALQNPSISNATTAATGTYTVTVTNAAGCSKTGTATATVSVQPTVSANGGTVCTGSTLNLTSSGGTTYSWAGPNGFTSALQNPSISNATTAATGTYTVTVTNASGCSKTGTAAATINAAPSVTITGTNAICSGTSTTFDAGAGFSSYLWSTGATTRTVNLTTAGTYTVTVTNASACTANATRSLTVSSLPAAPTVSVVNNCNGTSTLTASGVTGTLAWSNGGSDNPHIVSAAGSYTVTQSVSGCTSNASTAVTAAPKTAPAAPTLSGVNSCGGTSTLTVSNYTGTLAWSDGGSGNPRVVTTSGTYTVTQTVNGCTSPASTSVTSAPKVSPSCSITTSASCALGGAQNTYNAPAGMDSYTWSVTGCGSSISGSKYTSSVKINSSNMNGTYTVSLTVTDNGCTSTCSKTVTVKKSKDVCQYSCLYTTGSGYHPTVSKSPICAEFKVYDLNTCGGPNGRQDDYNNIWNSSNGQLNNCTVSDPVLVNYGGGPCYRYTLTVPDDQKCLILGKSTVSSNYYQGGSCDVYTGNKVNDDNDDIDPCTNNVRKFNCVLKDYNSKCREGSTMIQYGSELLIMSPAALEFTDSTENLPIIYESVEGVWTAEVSPTPPEGFYALPDSSLTTTVSDSVVDALQFTIVDTGSVWTYTELLHKLHHNGADRVTYSNPLMINKRSNKLVDMNIYPNPTTGRVTIALPQFEGKARVFVHDINGQKVMEQKINIVGGATTSIDLTSLPAGIYLIAVENDSGRVSAKLIKEQE
ncbi:MAG: T9SS type A sorting domain-containing protein, partial [Bacteroidetes bacterium]|nr:T9SS type A sorting domain-containing protein [Bacteroidota bacterium]